jgi:homocysteine S-methyltransferase
VAAFGDVLGRLTDTGLPVLAGLVALEGVRHAEFLASEVVGVRVPDTMLERLRQAKDETAEALTVALEIADWMRGRVNGVHVTSLHGTAETAERLLGALAARAARR